MNQRTKYLGYKSVLSIVIVRTHTPDQLLYLDH